MILDSCLFHDEYEMLTFRLKYLWDTVDFFVIVEADRSFSGRKKPLNFFNNRYRYQWAMDKIVYHPVAIDVTGLDFSYKPEAEDRTAPQWKVEFQQRNAIIEACKDFSDDDILMMSDCDEIPTKQVVEFRKTNQIQNPFVCNQRLVVFYLNFIRQDIGWNGTIVSTLKQAREITTQGLRDMRMGLSPMPHGGYHFSYFGSAEQIKKKIQSYSHQELNKEEYLDIKKIGELTSQGKGIFPDKGQPLVKVGAEFYPVEMIKLFPPDWWIKNV